MEACQLRSDETEAPSREESCSECESTPLANCLCVKIRRTTQLFVLAALSLPVVGCGPDVPAGLGAATSQPTSQSSQSEPTTPTDAGSASAPSSGSSTPTPGTGATVDSAAVLATVAQNAYLTSPSFTEVTRVPYESVAKPGTMIREWVSTSSLAAYESISPSVVGSGAVIAPGTTIVRAVLAADGTVAGLTLMYKGPAGYNPQLGDWWFGVTAPDGTPTETDAGPEVGLLTACFSCHVPRQNDGWLFGVPLDDRASDDAGAGTGTGTTPAGDAGIDSGIDAGDDAGDDDAGHDGGHHRGGR